VRGCDLICARAEILEADGNSRQTGWLNWRNQRQKKACMLKRYLRHPVVRNSLVLYTMQISGYLLPLITVPYMARILGPAKFGLLALAQTVAWYFIILADYGFNLTTPRDVALNRDDPAWVSKTFSTVMTAKGILLVVGFFLMAAIVASVPSFRREWRVFFLGYMMVIGIVIFPIWLFQGLEKLHYVGLRDFLAKLITLGCVLTFVHKQSDYQLAMGIQSGGFLVAGLMGLGTVPFVTKVRPHWPGWQALWVTAQQGWHVFLSNAAMALYTSTNIVILGLVASPAAVGLFTAAFRLMLPIRQLVGPIQTALYPYVSRMAAKERERAVKFLRLYAIWSSLPFLLIGIGTLTLGPYIVRLFFGQSYSQTGALLRIMSFGPMLLALGECFATQYMLGFGHTRAWTKMTLQAGVVNFLALGVLLAVIQPAVASAITVVILDVFIMVRSFQFYRQETAITLAGPPTAHLESADRGAF